MKKSIKVWGLAAVVAALAVPVAQADTYKPGGSSWSGVRPGATAGWTSVHPDPFGLRAAGWNRLRPNPSGWRSASLGTFR